MEKCMMRLRAKDWEMGRKVDNKTPPGVMIAKGWDNGKYPNKPSGGNHTGIYLGKDSNGNHRILEQNVHTDHNPDGNLQNGYIDPNADWHEVQAKCGCDKSATDSNVSSSK